MKKVLKVEGNQGFTFLDILLDERICNGTIRIDKELVRKAGGLNKKLKAKQKYELLLRLAQESNLAIEEFEDHLVLSGTIRYIGPEDNRSKASKVIGEIFFVLFIILLSPILLLFKIYVI